MYSSINKKFENSTIYRKAANTCFSFVNMNAIKFSKYKFLPNQVLKK